MPRIREDLLDLLVSCTTMNSPRTLDYLALLVLNVALRNYQIM